MGSAVVRTRLSLVLSLALLFSVALALPPVIEPVRAATFTVGPSGADYPDLAAALGDLDASNFTQESHTLIVAPGTYTASLVVVQDNFTIQAETPGTVVVTTTDSAPVITVGGTEEGPAVTLIDLEITGGSADQGGGVYVGFDGTAELIDTWVHDNTAIEGGGIYNGNNLTLTRSIVSANTATADGFDSGLGGGIFNASDAGADLVDSWVYDNAAVHGGGLYNRGSLTLSRTTLSSNGASDDGGGIHNLSNFPATISDSTISGNSASSYGGGIFNNEIGDVVLRNVTITQNIADNGGGVANIATITARNTIIAENTAAASGSDCYSDVVSDGHNLIGISDAGCFFTPTTGDLVGTNAAPLSPQLGIIASNGGPTPTHLPGNGSPVIDAGDNTGLDGLTDQTGLVSRTLDGNGDTIGTTDIGAVEYRSFTIQGAVDAAASGDTIDIPPGKYVETVEIDDKDLTLNGFGDVTIEGDGVVAALDVVGTSVVTVSGVVITGGGSSGLRVDAGAEVTLNDVTVTGNVNSDTGGGILNNGTLTMNLGAIAGNQAQFNGGGLANTGHATINGVSISGNGLFAEAGAGTFGGGIYTTGVLVVSGAAVIEGNGAETGGGISSSGSLTIDGGTVVRDNVTTEAGDGGGVYATFGPVAISNATFVDNLADGRGGALALDAAGATLANLVFDSNFAYDGGGAAFFDGDFASTITGSMFSKNHTSPGFTGGAILAVNSHELVVTGGAFANNGAGASGGAIWTDFPVSIDGTTFTSNTAGYPLVNSGDGGAISVTGAGGESDITGATFALNGAGASRANTPVVDAAFSTAPWSSASCAGTGPLFQGFTPAASVVDRVRLQMRGFAGQGGATLHIRLREGGPQGPVIAEADGYVAGPLDPGSEVWVPFTFAQPVALVPGTLHVIELTDFEDFSWLFEPGDPYPGNDAWSGCGGGVPLLDTDSDYHFETASATGLIHRNGGAVSTTNLGLTSISNLYSANTAGRGGAVYLDDNAEGINSISDIYDANTAELDGGAVYLTTFAAFNFFGSGEFTSNRGRNGGAIYSVGGVNSSLALSSSTLAGNRADADGGAVFSGIDVSIGSSDFQSNAAEGRGGAIRADLATLDVFDNETGPSLFGGNSSIGNGGAISASGGADDHSIRSALFASNTTAHDLGGGVVGYEGDGGALHVTQSTMSIARVAFVGNAARDGGAIYLSGDDDWASITAENVTITENYADRIGGGVWAGGGALFAGNSLTIADNLSGTDGGGIYGGVGVQLTNSIVALNTASDGLGPNCMGSSAPHITSYGYNLIGNDVDCTIDLTPSAGGDLIGDRFSPIDPLLEAAADNGGPTPTMALLPGSPAIDTGDSFDGVASLGSDQRGFPRPSGSADDIGAFESDFALAGVVVVLDAGTATTPVGASSVPIEDIPTSALTAANPDVIAATPVGDLAATPVNSIPVNSIPVGSIPVTSIAGQTLNSVLLIDVPIDGGWEPLLAGTALSGPLHLYTFLDAISDPQVAANMDAAGVGFTDFTLAATPVGSIPVSSIVLGALPVTSIPVNSIEPGTAEHLDEWCSILGFVSTAACEAALGAGLDGVSLLSLSLESTPVNSIPVSSIPVSSIPVNSIPVNSIPVSSIPVSSIYTAGTPVNSILLTETPINSIPVSSIPVNSIDLAGTPVGSIPVSSIPVGSIDVLFDCAVTDCTASTPVGSIDPSEFLVATYGQLLQVLFEAGLLGGFTVEDILRGLPDDATVADLIAWLLPPEHYPWQEVDLDAADLAGYSSGAASVQFTADVSLIDTGGPTDVLLDVTLPPGFTYVQDSAGFDFGDESITFLEPLVEGDVLSWTLSGVDADFFVTFDAVAGLAIGPAAASVAAELPLSGAFGTGGDELSVLEAFEDNDTPAAATAIVPDTIYLSHIASSDDADFFMLPGVATGSTINLVLSNMDVDLDLVLYAPSSGSLRGTPERTVNSITDNGLDVLTAVEAAPDLADDVPLAGRDVVAISANRGLTDEAIVTDPVRVGGDYIIQVTGYNGASSRNPYSLLPQVADPLDGGVCTSTAPTRGTRGSAPGPLAAGINTLFLVHRGLLEGSHPGEAQEIIDTLGVVANQPSLGVNGAVIEVDSDDAVNTLTGDWLADYCSIDAANAVAGSIATLVDGYRATNPGIEYVVFVGGDDQIPQFRLPDETEIANETGYATGLAGLATPQSAAFGAGFLLSDEPYGDPNPLLTKDGREIYVSQVALGRLVESPADILRTLDNFLIYNGLLDPSTTSNAFVSGYDFLIDGAEAVVDELDDTSRPISELIDNVWNAVALASQLLDGGYTVASVNAHFDHYRAEPAAPDAAAPNGGLFLATELDVATEPLDRALVFSMGCHSGLSVSDVQVGGAAIGEDFAQIIAGQGGSYVGNTGYGYGDTDVVALSETLMTNFAGNLDGPLTIGQALNLAKHQYVASGLTYGPYDDKVVHISTMYGLPFFRVGGGGTLPEAPTPPGTFVDGTTGLIAADIDSGDVGGNLVLRNGSRGDYYAFVPAGGRDTTQASPYRPIQPKIEIDVTQGGGLVAHGALITGLTSSDVAGFDPSVSRPIIELGSNEPEPVQPGIFPSRIQAVNRYLSASGYRDQLVLVPGQFRSTGPTVGIQRIFESIQATVFYSDGSVTDFDAPTILRASGTDLGGTVSFEVVARDPSGVVLVSVLYKSTGANGTWGSAMLTNQGGDLWTGGALIPTALQEFYVQAVDANGNVAVSSNKGELHLAEVAASPSTPIIQVSGPPPVGGWYPGDVLVTLDATGVVEYDLDGAGLTAYTGPFTVSGEGAHRLDVFAGGASDRVTILIDDRAGTASSPINGAAYTQGQQVPVAYTCADGGSGVASCVGPALGSLLDTSVSGSFAVTTTDNVGNQATVVFSYSVVAPPSANIVESVASVVEGTPVSFTSATDAISPLYTWSVARNGQLLVTGAGDALDFVADDDGSYVVTLLVSDAGVQSVPATEEFTVTNAAPIIQMTGGPEVSLGDPYALEIGPVDDPGTDNAFSFVVHWGDGESDTVSALGRLSHLYAVPGPFSITVDVTDEDGTFLAAGALDITVVGSPGGGVCDTAVPTIVGTDASEVIFGTNGDDVIFAGGGDDLIFGSNGDDIICGGDGWDTIYSGSGDDYVDGASGADWILGGNGDDEIDGGDGDDWISGQRGDDVIRGGADDDVLYGGRGNDTLAGGEGDDWISGGSGSDTISYERSAAGIVASLSDESATGDGFDIIYGEHLIGSAYADTLVGKKGTNRIDGLGGDDTIEGRGGRDELFGGDGDDTISGNGGKDTLDGGPGTDTLDGGGGTDTCIAGESLTSCEL